MFSYMFYLKYYICNFKKLTVITNIGSGMYHNRSSSGLFEAFLPPQSQYMNIHDSYLAVSLSTPSLFKVTALNLH